jgi:hypothetical protein
MAENFVARIVKSAVEAAVAESLSAAGIATKADLAEIRTKLDKLETNHFRHLDAKLNVLIKSGIRNGHITREDQFDLDQIDKQGK